MGDFLPSREGSRKFAQTLAQQKQLPDVRVSLRADLVVVAGTAEVTAKFELESGVLVLFGRSGSGKSLTIRALAGLVRPRRGHVSIQGRTLFDADRGINVPTHLRKVGYVPQHQGLFPFASVLENLTFGLPRRERSRQNPQVESVIQTLGLERLLGTRPDRLSGGERQRVALGRALSASPTILLLDEPFSAIDVEGKRELRTVLRAAVEELRVPTVLVTHDPEDALEVGDRVVRFRGHTADTIGGPREILADLLR